MEESGGGPDAALIAKEREASLDHCRYHHSDQIGSTVRHFLWYDRYRTIIRFNTFLRKFGARTHGHSSFYPL